MKKDYSWLGPFETIKDNFTKFAKLCTLESSVNKKIVKESGKPDKVAVWNFIENLRDNIIGIGGYRTILIGYENHEFLTLFQQLNQHLWKIFYTKFKTTIPIVPLSEGTNAGLYDRNCLREQFPGPSNGNAPGYQVGSFDNSQIGGWKWFSLILDEENWKKEWDLEYIPEKMDIKENQLEKIAPKYYKNYRYLKGKWKEEKNSRWIYGRPSGCKTIPRRFSVPVVLDDTIKEYENFIRIILKTLKTQWTLSVWNIISFEHKISEKNIFLAMKPEINVNIGWIETNALGEKEWGEKGENLHRHFDNVYNIRVGLPEKYKLKLPLYIKKKLNPLWNGSADGIIDVISEPYSRLLDLLVYKLEELLGFSEKELLHVISIKQESDSIETSINNSESENSKEKSAEKDNKNEINISSTENKDGSQI